MTSRWLESMVALVALLSSIVATSASATCVHPVDGSALEPLGDVNGDAVVNVTDALCSLLVNLWTLGGQMGEPPGCAASPLRADLDCGGQVDISDSVAIVSLGLGVTPSGLNLTAEGCPVACCAGSTATMVVDAGADASTCTAGYTLSASSNWGASQTAQGTWTVVSGQGTFADPHSPNTGVSALGTGANVFQWELVDGCDSDSDSVEITRQSVPSNASAGADLAVCGDSLQLAANTPTAGGGAWSVVSSDGSPEFSPENSPSAMATSLAPGANVLRWTISTGECTDSTDEIEVWSDEDQVADAGPPAATCGDVVQLAANAPIGDNTGMWSVVGANGSVADTSDPASIANLDVGTNTFTWRIDAGSCGIKESTVVHTRHPAPSTANAGLDQNIPAEQTSTALSAVEPTSGTGQWSIIEGGGVFSDVSDASAVVTGLSPGLNVFRWTVTLGACTSFAEVAIVRPIPCAGDRTITTAADVKNLRVCSGISGSLLMDAAHDVQDLVWLSNLLSVGGSIVLENSDGLQSLHGLEALVSIGGDLVLNNNDQLLDLSELVSLISIGGSLSVMRNAGVDNLALPVLGSVGEDVRVELNGTPIWSANPFAMPMLHSVGRDVIVQGNPSLDQCVANAFATTITSQGSAMGGTGIVSSTLLDYNDPTSCPPTLVEKNPDCDRDFVYVLTDGDVMQLGTCSVVTGDVDIRYGEVTSLEHLSGLTEITGNLMIRETPNLASLDGLDDLTTVGGYLYVYAAGGALQDVTGLNGVQTIGGFVRFYNNQGFTDLNTLNSLTSVGGYVYIDHNQAMTSISGFGALQSVGQYFRISNNNGLQTITGFQSLETVGHFFFFRTNPAVVTLDAFNALETVGQYMRLDTNHGLQTLDGFDSLTSVGQYIRILSNSSLIELSAFDGASPLTVTQYLWIATNASLQTISGFGALDTVQGYVSIYGNNALTSLEGMTNLAVVEGNIEIYNNPVLPNLVGLDGLTSVGTQATDEFRVYQNNSLTSLAGLGGLTEVLGTLRFDLNPQLTTADGLSGLSFVGGDLRFEQNDSLGSLGLNSDLGAVADSGIAGNLAIFDNPLLDQCLASGLRDQIEAPAALGIGIGGAVTLLNNQANASCPNEVPTVDPSLCNGNFVVSSAIDLLALASCTSIGGSLTIDGTSVESLEGLQNLASVGNLYVNYNPSLVDISHLSSLTTVIGTFQLIGNAAIPNLDGLEQLTTVGAQLRIQSNGGLLDIDGLSALETVGSHLRIQTNTQLMSVAGLSSLRTVGGHFDILQNHGLTDLQGLGSLESVGKIFYIRSNNSLTTLQGISPNLTSVGNLYIYNNQSLLAVDHLTGLVSIPGYVYIDHCFLVENLSGLENLQHIGNYLQIYRMNTGLVDLSGLESLRTVDNYVYILKNDALQSLDGLSGLETVGGYFYVFDNPELTNMDGAGSLESVGDYFRIRDNPRLDSTAGLASLHTIGSHLLIEQQSNHPDGTPFDVVFPALDTVGTHVEITNNTNLQHVSMPALQSVGTFFDLHTNASVHSGDVGLAVLATVPHYIRLTDTPSVASIAMNALDVVGTDATDYIRIENLANLASVQIAPPLHLVGDLIIFGNPQLAECSAYELSDAIGNYDVATGYGIEGTITIGNNDTTAFCN